MIKSSLTTQELVTRITPAANLFLQKTINANSIADYNKLTKIFDRHVFESISFDDANIDILNFDWQGVDHDRNWWWQIQALPFLSWYINSLKIQTEEQKTRFLLLCLDAVNNWIIKGKINNASPLVWHDHAAAFRLRNLTTFLVYSILMGLPLANATRAESLARLIFEHLEWIQNDNNYSKNTNHGFDQAMIALTVSSMFSCNDFEAYLKCNRWRLNEEISFAFTEEGVHKENSPGYQKMMLIRLRQLKNLAILGEVDVSRKAGAYIEKAEAFLSAITLPNGYLPMIGDTRGEELGLPYKQTDQIDVLDYSASGYIIIRGNVLNKDFHLVFKASHLSHYHRHDDDLSIHLYFNGKTILGDGGLGSHNEKDKKRKLLRSCISHHYCPVV